MLIEGVVHHFKHSVVQTAFIRVADVHSRPQPDGFGTFECLDWIGAVGLVFGHTGIESSILLRRLFGHKDLKGCPSTESVLETATGNVLDDDLFRLARCKGEQRDFLL